MLILYQNMKHRVLLSGKWSTTDAAHIHWCHSMASCKHQRGDYNFWRLKVQDKGVGSIVSPEGSLLSQRRPSAHCVLMRTYACVCPKSLLPRRRHHTGLEPTLITSFDINYFFKVSVSIDSHFVGFWRVKTSAHEFWGSTIKPITNGFWHSGEVGP